MQLGRLEWQQTCCTCALQARIADSKFSMSVDSEQQVVKLGTSTDMGFCRSRKKVSLGHTFQNKTCMARSESSCTCNNKLTHTSCNYATLMTVFTVCLVITSMVGSIYHSMHTAAVSCCSRVQEQQRLQAHSAGFDSCYCYLTPNGG